MADIRLSVLENACAAQMFVCLLMRYLEEVWYISIGTSESRRLFELSMKCGFVDAAVDKMLFHGSAGVGKTCTRNIVAGEKHLRLDTAPP